MSESFFDVLIHAPNRLQVCALLASTASIEFIVLREKLEVSDSVLSKHIKSLENAGYISLEKHAVNGRQRTWLSFTPEGRRAYKAHVKALKEIIG